MASTIFPTVEPTASVTDAIEQGLDALSARIGTARELLAGLRDAKKLAVPVVGNLVAQLASLGVRFDEQVLEGMENATAFVHGRCGPRTEQRVQNERVAKRSKAKGKGAKK